MKKKKLLITEDERRWIAKNAVKQMGKKILYDVMDVDVVADKIMEERKNQAMTPWVEIQPISEDMHKIPNRMATFQKDPITGVLYGIAVDQDEFGNIKWQKVQLHDHLSLNLDKRDDARIWAVLRFHPDVQGSPWQNQNPYYKIYDPVEEARIENSEIESMKLGFDRINNLLDDPKAMVHFSRYLGIELRENANYEIVRGGLLRFAKNSPIDFNRRWESKTRSYGEFFESARALGIIINEADRGFLYKGVSLGLSRPDAIKYLSQDSAVMNGINNELAEQDKVVQTVANTVHGAVAKTGDENDFE